MISRPPRRLTVAVALAAAALLLATATAGCGGDASGAQDGKLRIGLVPNVAPDKVRGVYQPFADYLERELDMEIELSVPTSYPAVVEAMASDRIDVALFGGLTYVQARERGDISPLVADVNPETGTTKYHSVIIVPAESDVRRVSELEGTRFAFGSVSSTSGSLYPSIMLQAAGIDRKEDLKRPVYTGGHDATAVSVANGRVAAGGLEERILHDMVEAGTIEESQVRIIERSDPIEGYPWVVRDSIDRDVRERLAQAFVNLDDPKLLQLLGAEGYERVEASDYDYIERKANELGLLTPSA